MHSPWTPEQQIETIEYRELFAVVAARAAWAKDWTAMRILLQCDNAAVLACIQSGTSRAPYWITLSRCLAMLCARMNVLLSAQHVTGCNNAVADSLSRNNLQVFWQLAPSAQAHQEPIPELLWTD